MLNHGRGNSSRIQEDIYTLLIKDRSGFFGPMKRYINQWCILGINEKIDLVFYWLACIYSWRHKVTRAICLKLVRSNIFPATLTCFLLQVSVGFGAYVYILDVGLGQSSIMIYCGLVGKWSWAMPNMPMKSVSAFYHCFHMIAYFVLAAIYD